MQPSAARMPLDGCHVLPEVEESACIPDEGQASSMELACDSPGVASALAATGVGPSPEAAADNEHKPLDLVECEACGIRDEAGEQPTTRRVHWAAADE